METVTMETKTSVQYIVADPAICHCEPIFRGTCIRVADVLEQVESGMAYEAIIEVALRSDKRCNCRSSPQSHVKRPPLMRPDWFGRMVAS
ncbi:MAG TPA: DUF433 domain-containing protein [Methanosarcinales archaeon]|nr:DUF433 domain-containing protein [Methanosarcinales archaeon]